MLQVILCFIWQTYFWFYIFLMSYCTVGSDLDKDSDPEPWAIFPMWFWQNDANPTHEQKLLNMHILW